MQSARFIGDEAVVCESAERAHGGTQRRRTALCSRDLELNFKLNLKAFFSKKKLLAPALAPGENRVSVSRPCERVSQDARAERLARLAGDTHRR